MTSFSVANINPGTVRAEFMASMMNLVEFERKHNGVTHHDTGRIHFGQFFSKLAGPYLDTERNACVEWFVNACTSDYLLFIDSDIAFRPDQAYTLVTIAERESLTLIGGVYHNALSGIVSPLAYLWQHDDSLGQRNLLPVSGPALESMSSLTDHAAVDAMGTGFMLISRKLIDDMSKVYNKPTPWFAELDIDGIQMGEDFTFCVRAAVIGHQPYIAPRIILDHFKVCCLRQQPSTGQVSVSPPPINNELEKV